MQEVYLAGLAGDYCVYYTAKDALQEGSMTRLVEDATQSISPEGFEKVTADI